MNVSLQKFAEEERERLEKFVDWYEAMSQVEPNHYPLTLEEDNAGAWLEMLMDFDPESERYNLPKK